MESSKQRERTASVKDNRFRSTKFFSVISLKKAKIRFKEREMVGGWARRGAAG